jgi:deoxyribonuclease IV
LTFKIGFHVSIAGGIHNSVSNAVQIGCTAFQIFTRNPRGWTEKALMETEIDLFKSNLKKSGIKCDCVAIHMPYGQTNLSAPDGELYEKSVNSFTNELIKCSKLGIKYLIIDLGSDRGYGKEYGIRQLLKSCERAVYTYKSTYKKKLDVTILLQNGWGFINSLGCTLEELKEILDRLPNKGYGVCLDTCHAFISGYDLRTTDACVEFIEKFDKTVGFYALKFIHLNDSKTEIGSHVDRHEHIGLGKIGAEGLKTIINHNSPKGIIESVNNSLIVPPDSMTLSDLRFSQTTDK